MYMRHLCITTLFTLAALLGGCADTSPDSAAPSTGTATTQTTADDGNLTPADASLVLPDAIGDEHRPLDVSDGKPNVVIFITTDCPVSNAFVPEYNRLHADLAERGVDLYLVHAYRYTTAESAAAHAAEFKISAPVLLDPLHKLVRYTGATITPEAALIAGPNGDVAYLGRVNNMYEDFGVKRQVITRHDLREAVDAVLAGQPVAQPRVEVIGCSIPGV